MELRFYIDPATGRPHIDYHGITEDEVRQVFTGSSEDCKADGDSRMRQGQTTAGRYLQVIYSPDEGRDSAFVITAYELKGKAKSAYRPPPEEERPMKQQKFPPGWNEKRVREVIAHYENQTEEEQAAEIEAALKAENITMVAVPTELVPKVLTLIQRRKRTA